MDRLSEIRARCEELEQSGEGFTVVRPVYIQGALLDDGYSEKWSALAAHAREDIPYLLAEVERLKQANRIAAAAWDNSALNFSEAQMERWRARAEKAEAERDTYKVALQNMRFAYVNKDIPPPTRWNS